MANIDCVSPITSWKLIIILIFYFSEFQRFCSKLITIRISCYSTGRLHSLITICTQSSLIDFFYEYIVCLIKLFLSICCDRIFVVLFFRQSMQSRNFISLFITRFVTYQRLLFILTLLLFSSNMSTVLILVLR